MKVVGALLAAGSSRRLGEVKQLLQADDGSRLVQRAAQTLLDSELSRVCVVLDPELAEIATSLAGLELDLLDSEAPAEGVSASIRAATTWALRLEADALLLCACDQPLLTVAHLKGLVSTFLEERGPAASYYDGAPGVPAVFPADHFQQLRELEGDLGATSILRKTRDISLIAWPEGACDLDTPADVLAWRARRADGA